MIGIHFEGICFGISYPVRWASGQVVRALDCCAKHRWFEPNPRIIVGMLAHCPPSSKWVPGNTREAKGGEERNWPPYLTMPAAQDKCPSNRALPQRTESYMGLTFTFFLSSRMAT